jgi:hypothetical protein
VPPVCTAHGCDPARVPRCRKPVVDDCSDLAALHRRLAGSMMTCHQEQDPVAMRDRLLERSVDRPPGGVKRHTVKVQSAVGLDGPRSKPAIPASVERGAGPGALW